MKSIINIELFEEHECINFYTLRFQGEETEVDKFLDQFPEGCKYDEDIDIIIKWMDKIGKTGALERYFRPESRANDQIWAIPIETSNLRLYVIRISEEILIIGNGGVKTTRTYNEDPILSTHVELLQNIDRFIKTRVREGKLAIYQKQLLGNLKFNL
ncbi:hypothetical protein [Saccharicrinis fermentans]|uniref:Uncharacterized protein n=1 Tax=Saccharicrinis fermentans DSM 9555 = JCM 21142 TaxID=869213 RepID=W7YBR1_9BACT|nr:hypothetical protein [Saccharicrinis fermentans]GAF05872.1 hypothetical protein JCM21142_114629 [Saccharicrinis fermentans DSM 9555 = JCM 21142]